MNVIGKLLFIFLGISGIALVFVVSWFWRLLLIPMIVILLWDGVSSLMKKKKD